jgi:hypothetical protein
VISVVNPYSRQKTAEDVEDDEDEDAKVKKRPKPKVKAVLETCYVPRCHFSYQADGDEDFGDEADEIVMIMTKRLRRGELGEKTQSGSFVCRTFHHPVYSVQLPNRQSLLLGHQRGANHRLPIATEGSRRR